MKNSEMLNNLYKILRMNIILARSNGDIVSEETIQNFEEAARKIDDADNRKYDEKTKDLYYTTKSLDEESERLEKLINIIDRRVDGRNRLIKDFKETTGRDLEALNDINDEDKILEYKDRYDNIMTYLSNKETISKIEEELNELREDLDKNLEYKSEDEKNNSVLEDDLLIAFKSSVTNTNYSKVINSTDIDLDIKNIEPEIDEQLKTLNTFDNAYNNLLRAGISHESEKEYSAYVSEAKKAYYDIKEEEFLLRLFKIISDSKSEYSELFNKRDELDSVLEERLKLRVDLGVSDEDILSNVYNVIDKQNKIIVKEKNVIDNITEIEDTIKFKETRLNELNDDNKRVEILALLKEYGIIDTYDEEVKDEIKDEVVEDNYVGEEVKVSEEEPKEEVENNEVIVEEEVKDDKVEEVDAKVPNMVVDVKDPYPTLNVGFARSKADTVMRRVGRSLGYTPEPKKEAIVSFDFNQDSKEEVKEKPAVNNSLSSLNLDDLNLNLKLDNKLAVDDEKLDDNNSGAVNPIFPSIAPSIDNNVSNNLNASELDKDVDKDFWSAEEDKSIFPSALVDNEIKVNKEESGFKLGSPISIGGNDENRN